MFVRCKTHLKKEYPQFQVEILLLHLLEGLVVVSHGTAWCPKGAPSREGMGGKGTPSHGMGGQRASHGEPGRVWEGTGQGGGWEGWQRGGRRSTQRQLKAQTTPSLLLRKVSRVALQLI